PSASRLRRYQLKNLVPGLADPDSGDDGADGGGGAEHQEHRIQAPGCHRSPDDIRADEGRNAPPAGTRSHADSASPGRIDLGSVEIEPDRDQRDEEEGRRGHDHHDDGRGRIGLTERQEEYRCAQERAAEPDPALELVDPERTYQAADQTNRLSDEGIHQG